MRLDLPEMLECAQVALAVEPSELTTERGLDRVCLTVHEGNHIISEAMTTIAR